MNETIASTKHFSRETCPPPHPYSNEHVVRKPEQDNYHFPVVSNEEIMLSVIGWGWAM